MFFLNDKYRYRYRYWPCIYSVSDRLTKFAASHTPIPHGINGYDVFVGVPSNADQVYSKFYTTVFTTVYEMTIVSITVCCSIS